MKKICIINGPNLNLLGQREQDIYGEVDFKTFFKSLQQHFSDVDLTYYQSNVEGEIVTKLQELGKSCDGIVLNAAAYTHTSVAILDAIKAIRTPVVEIHISNVTNRESFRHTSLLTPACSGLILGFGLESYKLAVMALLKG